MLIHRISAVLCLLMILISSWDVHAQEIVDAEKQNGDVLSLAERRKPRLWDVSLETGWLPSGNIHETDGDLAMWEVRAGFGKRFKITSRLDFSTGLRYSLQYIDSPDSARLPDSLHSLSIPVGCDYRASDTVTLSFRVSPGVSSDFRALATDDIRVPISFFLRQQISAKLTFQGGAIYTGGNHAFPVFPIIGILYIPSDNWMLALGFPRTGVIYKLNNGVELHFGAESGRGEHQLHESAIGADVISYRDFRGVVGVNVPLSSSVKLELSGGYSFARKFVFYEGNREDVHLDSVPFGKLEFKFAL